MEPEKIETTVIGIVAQCTKKDVSEIEKQKDARFKEDLSLTSMEYFPIIAELEEQLNIEVDYSDFLNKALTVNDCIRYVTNLINE